MLCADSLPVPLDDRNVRPTDGGAVLFSTGRKCPTRAKIKGLLVQQQLKGTEVIIGVKNDVCFGPVVMLGIGGVFTEIIRDVSYRFAPFSEAVARSMLSEIRGGVLLTGYRGKPVADIEALIKLLALVSQIAHVYRDEIVEIDLNPVIVGNEGQGAAVADALIVVRKPSSRGQAHSHRFTDGGDE